MLFSFFLVFSQFNFFLRLNYFLITQQQIIFFIRPYAITQKLTTQSITLPKEVTMHYFPMAYTNYDISKKSNNILFSYGIYKYIIFSWHIQIIKFINSSKVHMYYSTTFDGDPNYTDDPFTTAFIIVAIVGGYAILTYFGSLKHLIYLKKGYPTWFDLDLIITSNEPLNAKINTIYYIAFHKPTMTAETLQLLREWCRNKLLVANSAESVEMLLNIIHQLDVLTGTAPFVLQILAMLY